ncbi:uncharacterized mitochondrial protein AtMg00810-like [Malania oleifera]|uniref:uncharacterized mitochondrial protein AtMg00810-like n=1 Tax=Malania oleifera TaxID=397392 RepID=UPI0025ADAC3F|nr:uncharacterized mitochondrial protein AtMg00810-like [Malania oleifera]
MSSYMVIWLRRHICSLRQGILILLVSSTVAQLGFASNPYDSALFTRHTDTNITILLLYVDDMIITGDETSSIHELRQFICRQFEMKDFDSLSYFLDLEVSPTSDGYSLTQAKYASDLLTRAGLTDCKITDNPLEPNIKLGPTDGELLPDATCYRQFVESSIYLSVTRPNITYAVHLVSQFMSAPRSIYYAAVFRILRYVKGTLFHIFKNV